MKADPTITDIHGSTAAEVANSDTIRQLIQETIDQRNAKYKRISEYSGLQENVDIKQRG
jgi:hypothetical protein